MSDRCERLCEALKKISCEAALVHRPENIRYLTGYTGEGCVLVKDNSAVIITDFRYIEQAERQAPGVRVEQTVRDRRESKVIHELTDEFAIKTLAVETDFLTHDDFESLRKEIPFVSLQSLNGIPEELRLIKDADEIASISKACALSCKALENILPQLKPGMTEKQVQILLDFEMLKIGGEASAFATIAAAGVNGSLPHAIPSDYVIREGDLLTLDFGTKINGYCADMTRTIGFGKVRQELKDIYDVVYEAHTAALAQVRPGAVCGDLDKIARDIIDAHYPGAFGHSLGHGVGLFIHEQPRVAAGSETVLQSGYVITIEPGVYIPGVGGCRIEDTAIVTTEGFIDPVTFPKRLIEL